MCPEATLERLRHIAISIGCRVELVVVIGIVGILVIHLVLVPHTILQRHLRILRYRLVVGYICTHGVLLAWAVYILVEWRVEQRIRCHILPRLTLAKVVVESILIIRAISLIIANTICIVGSGVLLALVVLIVETTINSERSAWLDQLGAQLQKLKETEGIEVAMVVRVGVGQRLMRRLLQLLGILIFACGIALRVRPRVIALIGERCAGHQRCVTRDFPIQTGVETGVIVDCIRHAILIHITDRHRSLVPTLGARVVVGVSVVEEERALELNIVTASPLVGVVRSKRVNQCYSILLAYHILSDCATVTTTASLLTTHAQNILKREVLLVYIVKQADK